MCREATVGVTDTEIFSAAYDEPSGAKYWATHLSEPITLGRFALLLAGHQSRGTSTTNSWRDGIVEAVRMASTMSEPWLTTADKIHDWTVWPREAAEWLLSMPKRAYLVPASLATFIGAPQSAEAPAPVMADAKSSPVNDSAPGGFAGRPSHKPAFIAEMKRRHVAGELSANLAGEAQHLLRWGQKQFPLSPYLPSSKAAVENAVRKEYRKLNPLKSRAVQR